MIFKGKESASFYYDFQDGWGASVCVEKMAAIDGQKIMRKSKGFCGYDWMIDEIIQLGRIKTRAERIE